MRFDEKILFTSGIGGYELYRIPGIVITGKGTVIVYCEARRARDDWADMDILMRRSADGGNTWQPGVKLVDGVSTANTMNNPVMIAERGNSTVHFLYCMEYARCFYKKSTDDGATWSEPVEITPVFGQFKDDYNWACIATGPGHGIQLAGGRLLVAAWISLERNHSRQATVSIYSDDGGNTWERGEIIFATTSIPSLGEPVAVQRYDGSVLMNMRNTAGEKLRAVSTSPDGVSRWSVPALDSGLTDPGCFGGIVRFTDQRDFHTNRILFSNVQNRSERSNLTVKLSTDGGSTWPHSRGICPTGAAYSDIAVSNDKNTICCFYEKWEGIASYKYLTLARFDLEWLTDGEQKLDPL